MTTDYISRITPPVCEQEPGSVYDRIMTAIQMAKKTNRYVVMKKVFKEAYALFDEYRNAIPNSLFDDIVKNGILENPNYTPLHGMVMACLCAAFGQNDEILESLVANIKDQPGFVYFKPIISYYRSKRILDDYADKERIEHIRSLEKRDKEFNKKLREYERQIKQLQEENDTLRGALPSKQENTLTLEEILDYMLSKKKIESCEQIATMLNHFSRSLTEEGWNQVQVVENELSNGSLTNVVNHNYIERSYVHQGVMKTAIIQPNKQEVCTSPSHTLTDNNKYITYDEQ